MSLTPLELRLLKEHFPEEAALERAIKQVEHGEPLAYVIGEWYFWNETYRLNRDCLIPRPDTEHLVEWLIAHAPQGGTIADLCTGSGCIAISTLAHRRDLRAIALDISSSALEMAAHNAALNGVSDRFTPVLADVLQGEGLAECVDIIVSNPPYIHSDLISTLSPQVQAEPRRALDGGADGMDFYRAILTHYRTKVSPAHGVFLFEIGYDQREAICALAAEHSLSCRVQRDYGGNDRVAILTASSPSA